MHYVKCDIKNMLNDQIEGMDGAIFLNLNLFFPFFYINLS